MKKVAAVIVIAGVLVASLAYVLWPGPGGESRSVQEGAKTVLPPPPPAEGEGETVPPPVEGEIPPPAVPADGLSLLDTAAKTLSAQESLALGFEMVVASFDESSLRETVIEGDIKLGPNGQAMTHLAEKNREISSYNDGTERVVYLPRDKRYRKLPPLPDHRPMVASMMTGLLELPCIWLADLLDGKLPDLSNVAVLAGEYAGAPCWEVSGDTPLYSMRVSLQKEPPYMPGKITMALRPETVSKYLRKPASSVYTITTEFRNWQLGVAQAADAFTFTPPPDAVAEGQETPLASSSAQKGAAAPNFTLERLEGGTVQIKDHFGKDVIILDFFASWCGPCRRAMPLVAEVAKKFADKGVVLYAVNQRETREKVQAYLQKYGLSVPVLLDTRGQVGALYQVTGLPRMVVIGKDGTIKAIHHGMTENIDAQLTREIEGIL